uniref:Uncharacterized protein n=1 Tax=Siphoviridae sp. ctnMR5 TaxID=2825658 RepID=A0A8S5U8V7_9CAUD|nr:MAG TPA: hypothetical protein [Siphoviridae sp. ctnMR5]
MEVLQEKLLNERSELTTKLNKLLAFIETEKYQELSSEAKFLLKQQARLMTAYSEVLYRRIILISEEIANVKQQ